MYIIVEIIKKKNKSKLTQNHLKVKVRKYLSRNKKADNKTRNTNLNPSCKKPYEPNELPRPQKDGKS